MSTVNRALKPYPPADIDLVDTSTAGGGGVSLWGRYKASSMTAIADGAETTGWDDISGFGRHMTVPAGGSRPIKRSVASGLVGNTECFDLAGVRYFSLPSMAALTGGEIHYYLKKDTDSSVQRLHEIGTADDSYYDYLGIIYDAFGTSTRKTTFDPTADLANWHSYQCGSFTNDWWNRINNLSGAGNEYVTTSNTVAFRSNPQIGVYAGQGFAGRIAEIVILPSKSSPTFKAELNAYFQSEYSGGTAASFPATGATSGAVGVSWKNRNRLLPTIRKQTATTETLEPGQTTTIKVYGQDGTTLLRTITGQTGTSYNYTAAFELADTSSSVLQTSLTFKIKSTRDGYESAEVVQTVVR